jgi:hypothetical protein
VADAASLFSVAADIFTRLPLHAEVDEKKLLAKLVVQALQNNGKPIGHFDAQIAQIGPVFTVSGISGALDEQMLHSWSKSGSGLHIEAEGLKLDMPYKDPSSLKCLAFHFAPGRPLVADPLLAETDSQKLKGKGTINSATHRAEFFLSPAPPNDPWSCLPP